MPKAEGFAERLHPTLERVAGELPGRLGFAAWDLEQGEPVFRDEQRSVEAASTIKVLILITALHEVAQGRLRLDTAFALPPVQRRAGGFGVLRELASVQQLSLADLLTLMIVISDNAATNAVIDAVGLQAIAERARALGATATRVERRLMDPQATGRNVTTAVDQARVLDRLATGRALPTEQTRFALEALARQQVRDRLPALLPADAGCWNKTGELRGVRHDVGLVGGSRPQAVVAVLVDELTDERSRISSRGGPASSAIAELGRCVYRALEC